MRHRLIIFAVQVLMASSAVFVLVGSSPAFGEVSFSPHAMPSGAPSLDAAALVTQATATSETCYPVVQNLGNQTANVLVEFYDSNGVVEKSIALTIPAWSSTYFNVLSYPELGNDNSAVVSSDQPIAALTNCVDLSSGAAFGYTSAPAGVGTKLFFPSENRSAYPGGWNSEVWIQNAGSISANVTVTYYDGLGAQKAQLQDTISPSASKRFAASDVTQLGDTFVGSVVVSSTNDQPLTGASVNRLGDRRISYSPFLSGSTSVFLPSINRNLNGWLTWTLVQNLDPSQTASVKIEYFNMNGSLAHSLTDSIPPSSSHYYGTVDYPALGDDFVGSSKVTSQSGQPIVAVVNSVYMPTMQAFEYEGFAQGGQVAYFPSVNRNLSGWVGYAIVQNMDISQAVDVKIEYFNMNGSLAHSLTDSIPPSSSHYYGTPDYPQLGSDFIGALKVSSLSGQDIVATMNQIYLPTAAKGVDGTFAYNAVIE